MWKEEEQMYDLEKSFLSVDQLNQLNLDDLEHHENKVWQYYKKVKAVTAFTREIEQEED